MNANAGSEGAVARPGALKAPRRPLVAPVVAGLVSWGSISLGFLGLTMLMEERPQFVGQPMSASKEVLVQESPRLVGRKVTEDVSVVRPLQPDAAEVRFAMQGRRDYRGLKTISDMSGDFRARYVLTNAFEEPMFVLFKCPHPHPENRAGQGLLAGGLRLQASVPGVSEETPDAWFWSGTLAAHGSAEIQVAYQVASLKGVVYRIGDLDGTPVRQLRVAFQRQDLTSMRFESRDGTIRSPDGAVVWERKDFLAPEFFSANIVESRNLFASLSQLLEIGPVITLLFLLAATAVMLARQPVTALQVLTISAGYALYFPLILYLSARFSFPLALAIAVVVPGALLVNYARWLLGGRVGLVGGAVFLGLYQVFPTLAAFAGWNRGMVLLCLGVITLWVLIHLQNQALKRRAAMALLVALGLAPGTSSAGEIQVVIPAELAGPLLVRKPETDSPLLSFEPARYDVRQETTFFQVEVTLAFQVLRPGGTPVPLFGTAVHVQESHLQSPEPDSARLVTATNRLALFAQRPGAGTLQLSYRVPVVNREGKRHARIPLLLGPPGHVRLESVRDDLEILTASLWSKSPADQTTTYDIGVAGEETLTIEWRPEGGDPDSGMDRRDAAGKEFYGIGLSHAQHLTVINSDGSCTHFAEFELPGFYREEFRVRLPAEARLISVSVNGTELGSPVVDDLTCRVRLPDRTPDQAAHRLSFRLAYPPVRLGFVGSAELVLPEVFQTCGTLEWVVALPGGFETQVLASGLETQKTPPDLSRFGDYGRILTSHPHTYLAKDLAPPGRVSLGLKYRQVVRGMYEPRSESP